MAETVAGQKPCSVMKQVAEGVLVHESEFCQSNAGVVQGHGGVLLIDPRRTSAISALW